MTRDIAGFPFWDIRFDEEGQPAGEGDNATLLTEAPAAAVTDLFFFSHGWNNDARAALNLYERFFERVRTVFDGAAHRPATIAVAGVFWPAKRWADEPLPAADAGGAAALAGSQADGDLVRDLANVFTAPAQRQALGELARLLDERPEDVDQIARFQQLMAALVTGPDTGGAEDNGEHAGLLQDDPETVFQRFAAAVPQQDPGGAAGFGPFDRLWNGAKEALRQATYFEMKKRAGVVGKVGLGPLIARLHGAAPALRIHLVGHSFGARLVAYALAGLPDSMTGADSPVKSVSLLQGAFSHFAFAASLPFDVERAGALSGMQARVNGPLLASHSLADTAVGVLYPLASFFGRQDAAAEQDLGFRWGAIGHDGAQAVDAASAVCGDVGTVYTFQPGKFVNLDGNSVIIKRDPITGAHGDIFHEQIAWAVLAAAGIAGQ